MTRIAFRVDASLEMGSGHVMRCLTLADRLKDRGAECHFICREHIGNLIDHILAKGYPVHKLPASLGDNEDWLGVSQQEDAAQCMPVLQKFHPTWLVVDHYGIDFRWHAQLRTHYQKLMVIDDLADRRHQCDLLLDQTFGRSSSEYQSLVPSYCELLCGSHYALLRQDFSSWRERSLARRRGAKLQNILITLGGVGKNDIISRVLDTLCLVDLPVDCEITVIAGVVVPDLSELQERSKTMRWPTTILENVSNMAELMAHSDLAIGAAGATSWERCCLGLPAIMLVLAKNQEMIANMLSQQGAVKVISSLERLEIELKEGLDELILDESILSIMSEKASKITNGLGAIEVAEALMSLNR